jgi:hypothetical protein
MNTGMKSAGFCVFKINPCKFPKNPIVINLGKGCVTNYKANDYKRCRYAPFQYHCLCLRIANIRKTNVPGFCPEHLLSKLKSFY